MINYFSCEETSVLSIKDTILSTINSAYNFHLATIIEVT